MVSEATSLTASGRHHPALVLLLLTLTPGVIKVKKRLSATRKIHCCTSQDTHGRRCNNRSQAPNVGGLNSARILDHMPSLEHMVSDPCSRWGRGDGHLGRDTGQLSHVTIQNLKARQDQLSCPAKCKYAKNHCWIKQTWSLIVNVSSSSNLLSSGSQIQCCCLVYMSHASTFGSGLNRNSSEDPWRTHLTST